MGLWTIRPRHEKPIIPLLLFNLNRRDCSPLWGHIVKLYIYIYIYSYDIYMSIWNDMYLAWSVHVVNVVLQQHLQIITVRAGTDN